MKNQLLFTMLCLFGFASFSNAQMFSVGAGLEQSIDILQAPRQNSPILYKVTGNGFTILPMANLHINDNTTISIQTGGGLSFMSKNNTSGEGDRDLLITFPIGAKVSFGSASNTGRESELFGWWVGAGRQWRNSLQIHGTTTEAYTTYYGEIGGTINATDPGAIGLYFRYGAGASQTYAIQLGLSFTFNKVD
jgi:hypothetical protein